ncbi:MAG: ATP-dependent DNA helicase [Abditibacteriales bacterium]|nr:ATP-dependent DNA helicase [Abditibacteriales bacterium]MDW8366291.1 ATP-dependent DNA helicase [Abditibacteriales bacterium]
MQQSIDNIFAPDGQLARCLPTYEHRIEQQQMAHAVAQAIEEQRHLLVEAGTGTGKSLAYLVPFILWATRERKRVLVATYTKTLQQQLMEKDLPFLRERLGLNFRYALCLGTQNYLCPRRLSKTDQGGLFASREEVVQFNAIKAWARKTETGLLQDLDFEPLPGVWAQVNRQTELCLGKACPLYDQSFFYLARRQQSQAHVLVANHHLLFAHLAAGGGVLPPFDAVVLDEAHQIEEVAAGYLGLEVSNVQIHFLLEQLHSRRSGKGVLSGIPGVTAKQVQRLAAAAEEVRLATDAFFDNLLAKVGTKSTTVRLRHKNFIPHLLREPLTNLIAVLKDLRREIADEAGQVELEGYENRFKELNDGLESILKQDRDNHVYWVTIQSRPGVGRGPSSVRASLNMAPIDVAEGLRVQLFNAIKPVVMTSATLSTGGSFEFIKSRLGLDECKTLRIGSPFDYKNQVMIYVAEDLPDPSARNADFERQAIERAAEILKITDGRAFVLCTSHRMVAQTHAGLSEKLPHLRILQQGEMPRGKLVEEFRADVKSVLVGTTTFWQGIDVPGEALQCVVLMRLPFAVPDDPLVEARMESLQKRNEDPFYGYQVPQAIIMFRQGFGRLIRHRDDYGLVAILDPRVIRKRYGEMFLASLPECRSTGSLEAVKRFLESKRITATVDG